MTNKQLRERLATFADDAAVKVLVDYDVMGQRCTEKVPVLRVGSTTDGVNEPMSAKVVFLAAELQL
jgi:hypothetical protein